MIKKITKYIKSNCFTNKQRHFRHQKGDIKRAPEHPRKLPWNDERWLPGRPPQLFLPHKRLLHRILLCCVALPRRRDYDVTDEQQGQEQGEVRVGLTGGQQRGRQVHHRGSSRVFPWNESHAQAPGRGSDGSKHRKKVCTLFIKKKYKFVFPDLKS